MMEANNLDDDGPPELVSVESDSESVDLSKSPTDRNFPKVPISIVTGILYLPMYLICSAMECTIENKELDLLNPELQAIWVRARPPY